LDPGIKRVAVKAWQTFRWEVLILPLAVNAEQLILLAEVVDVTPHGGREKVLDSK